MNLPPLSLPQVQLPFDVPVLMHPPVDHFAIALPILILLIEIINLVAKKRAISVLSLFMLLLTVIAAGAAYYTGGIDGREAFDLLSPEGQEELKEHKVLGTYLMLFSAVVLLFKLISMMISKGLAKAIYLFMLIVFVAGILKQGKDGGELVYEFGANVEAVKALDDKNFDLQEEIDELKEQIAESEEATEEVQSATEETVRATETPATEATPTQAVEAEGNTTQAAPAANEN